MPFISSFRSSFGPQAQSPGRAPALYIFTTATFTPGGATGANGPTITQARSSVGNPSWASTYLNMPGSQGIMHWTVPETATYSITARGANGKPATNTGAGASGGRGIIGTGTVALTEGTIIRMAIGQQGIGIPVSGGGGGATYVMRNASGTTDSDILIIAGGGGGRREASTGPGIDANSGPQGRRAAANSSATNGGFTINIGTVGGWNNNVVLGEGGSGTVSNYGDGGAGIRGNGFDDGTGNITVAQSFVNGSNGGITSDGSNGGFGGGGAGQGGNGGGGGGGYTGGNGGHTAGGGGSYSNLTGTAWSFDSNFTTGSSGDFPGYVTITKL